MSKDTPRARGGKKDPDSCRHRCNQCGHEAESRRQLVAHEMSEHGGRAPSYSSRQCEHCDFIALNRRALTAHRAEAHPELAEPILCHLCGFATETKSKLQRHVAAKHGNYQCEQCDFSTPLHRKLVQHVKNIHREICGVCSLPINDGESLSDGSHACPAILGKGKPDPEDLFRIIRIKSTSRKIGLLRESDGGGYVCLDCGASYRVMLVMRRHVVMMHGSHVCGECDFVGESRPELDRHMAERHPLVCKKCGMEAQSRSHLDMHACSMTPNVEADPTGMNPAKTKRNRLRLTTCDIPGCNVVFTDRKTLRQHRKDAHGREAQVPCEVCGKYFANNTKLRLHVKTQHEGVKDMGCPFCAYATGDSGNFVKHVRKSHPERGPECPYPPCQFRAASMPALSRHVASEHRMGGKVEPEDSMQH